MTQIYKLWLVLLVLSGGIALWFSGMALAGAWNFTRLNAQTPATVFKWDIQDLSSSRFAIIGEYQYEVNGAAFTGKTVFESPQFLNRFAAENYVRLIQNEPWQAWYTESKPVFSSLEREFPQKQCLQALLTLGVFVYFYFARSMLSKFTA